jgi:hypothetical protein
MPSCFSRTGWGFATGRLRTGGVAPVAQHEEGEGGGGLVRIKKTPPPLSLWRTDWVQGERSMIRLKRSNIKWRVTHLE